MNHKSYLKGLGIGIIVTALVLMISGKINNKVSDDYVIKRARELGMTESTTLTAPLQNNPEVQTAEVTDSNNGTSDSDIKNNSKDSDKEISDVKNNSDTSNSDNSDVKDSSDTSDKDKSEVANNSDDKYNSDNSNDKSTTNNSDNGVSDANDNSNNANSDDKNKDTGNSGDKNSDNHIADNNSAEDKNNKTENNSENIIFDPNVKRVTVEVKGGQSSETVSNAVMNAGLCESETEFNKYLCQNGYDKRLRVGVYNIPVDSDFETISKYLCGMIEE